MRTTPEQMLSELGRLLPDSIDLYNEGSDLWSLNMSREHLGMESVGFPNRSTWQEAVVDAWMWVQDEIRERKT